MQTLTDVSSMLQVDLYHSWHFDLLQDESTVALKNINEGSAPFRWSSSRTLAWYMLAHWHGLLGHIHGLEPSLLLLVTPEHHPPPGPNRPEGRNKPWVVLAIKIPVDYYWHTLTLLPRGHSHVRKKRWRHKKSSAIIPTHMPSWKWGLRSTYYGQTCFRLTTFLEPFVTCLHLYPDYSYSIV